MDKGDRMRQPRAVAEVAAGLRKSRPEGIVTFAPTDHLHKLRGRPTASEDG